MDLIRVLVTTKTALAHTFRVAGEPTDSSTTVTVVVKRLDGTSVAGSPFTATHGSTGVYTFDLPASAVVDTWTLDWQATIGGAAVVERDVVEHAGGFLVDIDKARTAVGLSAAKYPYGTLAEKRNVVEDECEQITGRAWVPRFKRYLLDGSGAPELVVPDMFLRTLRAAKTALRAGATFGDLTAGEVAAVAAQPEGILIRDDGNIWPQGHRNVIVEIEHGLDYPPPEIRDAATLRMQSAAGREKSNIPARAISWTAGEGGIYRISTPSRDRTGIPDVDGAYSRYPNERVWIS